MGNDTWDWPGAFERAGKTGGPADENLRLTETLKPEDFARALRSMWVEHGMIERSDPRVQEFSRAGRLEWWDGRGRCVVLVREGSRWQADQAMVGAGVSLPFSPEGFAHPLPEPDPPPPATFRPVLEGTPEARALEEAQFNRRAADLIKGAEDRAIVAEQAKIDAKPKGKKK